MGQIKKVRVNMTENTSKIFTEVMLNLYDKYKDTDILKKDINDNLILEKKEA